MTLTVSNLSVSRGGIRLLENLNFSVPAGSGLILRAPNGAGKTTLLRTLAGLQPAEAGDVSLGPEQMAYAAHADAIKASLTVSENLKFWSDVFATDFTTDAIEAFRLTSLLERPAGELSSGQKRRLGLARLLLTGRVVWLLDEPTVSLDGEAVGWFGAVVKDHLSEGGIAVVATHIDLGLDVPVLDLTAFKADANQIPIGAF